MKKIFLIAAFTCFLQTTASATLLIDQYVLDDAFGAAGVINECCTHDFQTFTVGLTGNLAGVNVNVVNTNGFDLRIGIYKTITGQAFSNTTSSWGVFDDLPTFDLLTSTIVSGESDTPYSLYIPFVNPLFVNAGEKYALGVDYPDAPFGSPSSVGDGYWKGQYNPAPYDAGRAFAYNGNEWVEFNVDYHFRTYVETSAAASPAPEPATITIFGMGLMGTLIRRRRKM